MRWIAIPYLICCATLSAQINHLATTSDGSIVYLSGNLNLIGTSGWPDGSIFRYRHDTRSFEDCILPGKPSNGSAFAGASLRNVSADGSLISWVSGSSCTLSPPSSQACLNIIYAGAFGEITDPAFLQGNRVWVRQTTGALLSANGKFAVLGGASNMDLNGSLFQPFQLLSLADGNLTDLNRPIAFAGTQAVSDNGEIVLDISQSAGSFLPVLFSATGSTPLKFSNIASQVALSRDGQHIVYVSNLKPVQLLYYDVASGTERLLATAPEDAGSTFGFHPVFDDNGTTVLYVNAASSLQPPQMFLWTVLDPPPGQQIGVISEGVTLAVLSGSAAIAYAATANNRFLRVDVSSGDVQELSGRVPVVTSWSFDDIQAQEANAGCPGTPGSLMVAHGSGLKDPGTNGSVQVSGTDAFVVGGSSNTLYFQLPWDFPATASSEIVPVTFGTVSNPVFGKNATASICANGPQFISFPLHQNFRGPVTPNDWARAGEIIHFYMTGLGPVSPPAQTGVVASASPRQLAQPLACQATAWPDNDPSHGQQITMQSLFWGLAPGMIGVYQFDTALPGSLPPVPFNGLPPSVGTVEVNCNASKTLAGIFYR